jgi:hypothetical protein
MNNWGTWIAGFQLGPLTISGLKFEDVNGNGIQDTGEPGLAGWVIQLIDAGSGAVISTTTTDAAGNYQFANVAAGTFRVREMLQPGWVQTTANPPDINTAVNGSASGVDFGNFRLTSVTGVVFHDLNLNGVQDPGEPGLAGFIIQLLRPNGTVAASTVSDGGGVYLFANVGPGTFIVREVHKSGFFQTAPPPPGIYTITTQSGTPVTGLNFGNGHTDLYAFSGDTGGDGTVHVFNARTGKQTLVFTPYGPFFTGGVRIALGDVNGDGIGDVITGAGPGGGPRVEVINGKNGAVLFNFFAFDPGFRGGVFVAAGDVNGDGFADIIVGADSGGGPRVEVFSGRDGSVLANFFAYSPDFRGGVHVAAGDVEGTGLADIVTGPGAGGGPEVRVFRGSGAPLVSFFAYDPGFSGGVFVAAGDVTGSGRAQVITGPGLGGGPDIRIFDGRTGRVLSGYMAFEPQVPNSLTLDDFIWQSGARVAAVDFTGAGVADVLAGAGPAQQPEVRAFQSLTPTVVDDFFAFDPPFRGGVFVAGF